MGWSANSETGPLNYDVRKGELEEPDSLTDGAGQADTDTSQDKTDGGRTPKKAGRSKARKAKNTFSKVRFKTNGSEKETGSQKQP